MEYQQFSFLNIQTLHNYYLYIYYVHLLFCAHLINIFLYFRSVGLGYFIHPKCLVGVCVICDSRSFLCFILNFKRDDFSQIEHVYLMFCAYLILLL